MALSILNVAFDVGGKSISRFESLRNLITDEFCKYLFQLAKTDSIPLLTLTLRVISTVFDTMRPYLKLQQELFLFFLIERLTRTGSTSTGITYNVDEEGSVNFVLPNPDTIRDSRDSGYVDVRSSSPGLGGRSSDSRSVKSGHESSANSGEVRELLLECLTQCARIPTFMVDLWVNFDSDISCGNLFEELIHFLSKVNIKSYMWIIQGWNEERSRISTPPFVSRIRSRSLVAIQQVTRTCCAWILCYYSLAIWWIEFQMR